LPKAAVKTRSGRHRPRHRHPARQGPPAHRPRQQRQQENLLAARRHARAVLRTRVQAHHGRLQGAEEHQEPHRHRHRRARRHRRPRHDEEAEIIELEPGIYDVAGSYSIDEFLDYFEIENVQIAEERGEDVDTIADWITSLVGDLPEGGKTVRIGPLNVEVLDVERRRIKRVRVSRILSEGEAQTSEA
jgi:hypothetical protein